MPDVVVVGGGVAGCAVALELLRRDAAVTLVERRSPGAGATGASAGMLAPRYEATDDPDLLRFAVASRAAWPEFAARVEEAAGTPVGLRWDGMLVANPDPDDDRRARRMTGWQDEVMEGGSEETDRPSILEPGEARRLHPWARPQVTSYLWLPAEGQVDAQRLAPALGRAVERSGGEVRAGQEAEALLVSGGEAAGVRMAGGEPMSAAAVVLAAGAWSPGIEGLPRPLPVRPVRGQMLRLRPPSPPPAPLLADRRGRYLVPRHDGSVLAGATVEEAGFEAVATPEGEEELRDSALRLAPPLREAETLERWAGLRPVSTDGAPILGPDPELPGLLYATGYGRNGILFAPLAARAVAELTVEGETGVRQEPFRPDRFGPAARR